MTARTILFTAFLALSLSATATGGGGPENVLVLVNVESEESLAVARHYVHRRGIPVHHVVHLRIPQKNRGNCGSMDDGERWILDPVRAWMTAHPEAHITTILLSRDVPVVVALRVPEGAAEVKDRARSVTHMLAVMDDPRGDALEDATTAAMQSVPNLYARGWDESIDPRRPIEYEGRRYPMYSVGCLNAFTAADARALVDRAIAAEERRPEGTVYLGRSNEGDPRGMYNGHFPSLEKSLADQGFKVEIVPYPGTAALLVDRPDVLVYQFGQAGWDAAFPARNRYVPGALVDNLTSVALTEASFDPARTGGQTSMCHFLAAGASAVMGCVREPYTAAFSSTHVHVVRYLAGYNLIESYHMAHPLMPWMNLVAGDPLLQPFAVRPEVAIESFAAEADGVAVEVRARATRPGAGIERLRAYVDGRLASETEGDHASFRIAPFDPAFQTLVVVAIDDSKFRTQGRAVRGPSFEAGVPAGGIRFEGLSNGKARFRIADRPVVFRWYAPTATRPMGSARGTALELEIAGGPGNYVDLYVHADPSGEAVGAHFALDDLLRADAMAAAGRAREAGDVEAFLQAATVLARLTLPEEEAKKVAEWKAGLEAEAQKAWDALAGRLPRRPGAADVKGLEAFASKWNGLSVAQEARTRLVGLLREADEAARPDWEAAVALHGSRKWVEALAAFQKLRTRHEISSYAAQAAERIAAIEADPEAKGALGDADLEEKARRLYSMAKNYRANGLAERAREALERILAEYPDTEAAQEARKDLGRR